MTFNGFPKDCFTFLQDLSRNNDKAWFEAHREAYDRSFVAPACAFVEAIGPMMAALDPAHKAEPRVNGSLRRIFRDTRFSKDKTPYHDYMHLVFWTGGHPNRSAGIHLILRGDSWGYGAGQWGFEKETLTRYRAALADPASLQDLEQVIENTKKVSAEMSEPELKRPPAEFADGHPAADYARRKALVVKSGNLPLPQEVGRAGFVMHCMEIAESLAPLNKWLKNVL